MTNKKLCFLKKYEKIMEGNQTSINGFNIKQLKN